MTEQQLDEHINKLRFLPKGHDPFLLFLIKSIFYAVYAFVAIALLHDDARQLRRTVFWVGMFFGPLLFVVFAGYASKFPFWYCFIPFLVSVVVYAAYKFIKFVYTEWRNEREEFLRIAKQKLSE